MRILIVDCTMDPSSWGSADIRGFAVNAAGSTVLIRRAPQEDLPTSLAGIDKVIISGSRTSAMDRSGWVFGLETFIRRALDENKPILGVCYGHQMIARSLCGPIAVQKSPTPEFGWVKIERNKDSALFKDMPKSFYSFCSHFDEVTEVPAQASNLASSERCGIHAFELTDRPVFGVQFHPEKNLTEADRTLTECLKNRKDITLLYPEDGSRLYNPIIGDTLFRNFLEL